MGATGYGAVRLDDLVSSRYPKARSKREVTQSGHSVPSATYIVVMTLMICCEMPANTNEEEGQLAVGKSEAKDPIVDAQMARAGELYEDVNDIFRLAQRVSVLIVKHRMNISHLDAARIVEKWWFGCRRKF